MSKSLRKFASIGTQLCLQACNIINSCYHNKNLKKYMKGLNDPVTEADLKVQTMLTRGIRTYYPSIRIIGEESTEYVGNINIDYGEFGQGENSFLPSYIGMQEEIFLGNSRQNCLWIDPLDCTCGFIQGNVQDVTVLIGMSINKRAHFGIIGTPFKRYNEKIYYNPSIVFGSVGCQQTYEYTPFQREVWKQLKKKPLEQLTREHQSQKMLIATSKIRQNQRQNAVIRGLNANSIKAGGSGRKIMMVAKQEANAMLFIDSCTHMWDSCAGQAIIKSMGGYFATPNATELEYDQEKAEYDTKNREGIVCALHQETYDRTMKLIEQLKIVQATTSHRNQYADDFGTLKTTQLCINETQTKCSKYGYGHGYGEFLVEVIV